MRYKAQFYNIVEVEFDDNGVDCLVDQAFDEFTNIYFMSQFEEVSLLASSVVPV